MKDPLPTLSGTGLFSPFNEQMMKTYRFFLGLALFVALLSPAAAQERIRPRETWPYLYEDFLPGAVYTSKESTFHYDQLNVNILNGRLHYIQGGVIMETDMRNVHVAKVGEDTYINAKGRLMRVLAESEHGAVLRHEEVDFDEFGKASIGYGKSAVASTQNVALYALDNGDGMAKKSLEHVLKDKHSGREFPLQGKTWLIVDGFLIRAAKAEVSAWPGVDKQAAKAFFKQEKIKWSRTEDLLKVIGFVHEQLEKQ